MHGHLNVKLNTMLCNMPSHAKNMGRDFVYIECKFVALIRRKLAVALCKT